MKILLLILTIFFTNGCSEPEPCKPVACVKVFPKLPTYKLPAPKGMTPPVYLGDGKYSILGKELEDCLKVNARLRKICRNYASINSRVNKEYQK